MNFSNHPTTPSTTIKDYFQSLLKFVILSVIIGLLVGSASAFFLITLDEATNYRESHQWIIWLLPLAGLGIGLSYHYWGNEIVKGNNLIIDEFLNPQKKIPLRMTPMILFCTVTTHLFGGSAGREGTAVQMGGSIADQFTKLFKLNQEDRKIILILGISAGFSAIFGTPFAAAIFSLEVLMVGRIGWKAILPSFLVAFVADKTCQWWPVKHTIYNTLATPPFALHLLGWAIIAGIIFGLTALLFSKSVYFFDTMFKNKVSYPPLRPLIGGFFIAITVYLMHTTEYIGLGIPTIIKSFNEQLPDQTFFLKIVFTAYTLGAGFKGGEVTPLFFIGAALGNTLSLFIPLPMALLAGIGFVAIFAGATNTPIACTIMGMELFGIECGIFMGVACVTAYFFSGSKSIYSSQPKMGPKYFILKKLFINPIK